MKKTIYLLLLCCFYFNNSFCQQEKHISIIHDFNSKDFDNSIVSFVSAKDSLFGIFKTPNYKDEFFRIDENGNGYSTIWKFDSITKEPNSLIIKDSLIFGTTRMSANNGGSIFQYSIKNGEFKFIKDFNFNDDNVQDTKIEKVTDSVLWLSSKSTANDLGSIFTVHRETGLIKKIVVFKDTLHGFEPADVEFYNDTIIYISMYAGGNTFPDGLGTYTYSGCINRVNTNGENFETIIYGNDTLGTNPYSVIIKENKLYGMFSYTGNNQGASFFSTDLDGSNFKKIGQLENRVITNMLESDSLIYAFSTKEIFGIDPYNNEYRIFDKLDYDSTGHDISSNATYLNGNVFFSPQQGGPNGGGTILKWKNSKPSVNPAIIPSNKLKREAIDLKKLFTDTEKDSLTFKFIYEAKDVEVNTNNSTVSFSPKTSNEVKVVIIANDGWGGYSYYNHFINRKGTASIEEIDFKNNTSIYPNPAKNLINIVSKDVNSIEIYTLSGSLLEKLIPTDGKVNVEHLKNGKYIVKLNHQDTNFKIEKFIKE
jgi:hypothetical protein